MSSKAIILSVVLALTAAGLFAYNRATDCLYGNQSVRVCSNPVPQYVATIAPLASILTELSEGRAEVHTLLKPGASPHTYEPVPSDLKQAMCANGLFYVDERLDGWAAGLQAPRKVRVLGLVPEDCMLYMEQECCPKKHAEEGHTHAEAIADPHFWLDPCVVRDSIPALVGVLCELDPEGRDTYEANGRAFTEKLVAMDRQLHELVDPLRGSKVATTHPSFQYLCSQYGLEVAMVITDSPGKEPSPRQMEKLVKEAREKGVKAIYSEPQIPQHAAKMLSEASGLPLFELDPVGGCSERSSYDELILYNAQVLVASLK